jgi:hypothetical protein
MSRHHQLSLGPMEEKPLTQPRAIASSAGEQEVTQPRAKDLLALIAEAVDEGTCSEKTAAISLGLPSPQYWSAVKAGERPAPRCNRVTDLPEHTQKETCKRWARQLGMRVSEHDERQEVLLNLVESAARALRVIA